MTATGHALIGTVIAAKIGNPLLAAPLALGSHFLCDLLPHWDAGTNRKKKTWKRFFWESAADVAVSFVASYILIQWLFPETNLLYALFIILLAQGPDWITAPYCYFNMKFQPFRFFYETSSKTNSKLDKPWGIVTQVAAILIIVAVGKFF